MRDAGDSRRFGCKYAASTLAVLAAALAGLASGRAATCSEYLRLAPERRYAFFDRLAARVEQGEGRKSLEDEIPGLDRRMRQALEVSEKHWARSTTFDELAKGEILSGAALDRLGIPRETTAGVTHVPAGLMHTYGYLFSRLRTPYGLKGKRWIESRLDERLGLPRGAFSPFAAESGGDGGEFLSNLTLALHRALKGKNKAAPLEGRLEERVAWETGRSAVIRTHLVRLMPLEGAAAQAPAASAPPIDTHLLVHEIELGGGSPKLVTAFPVNAGFAASLMAQKPAKGDAFKPRYNLYVDPSWKVVSYESMGFVRRR